MPRNHAQNSQSRDRLRNTSSTPKSQSVRGSWCKGGIPQVKRRSRTLNACEPCKRRKTKCSGRPGPCEACEKAQYKCRFAVKNEQGRKIPTVSATQDGELYLLNGLLQALKYGAEEPLMKFVDDLRQNRSPQDLASSLRPNLEFLQDHGVIAKAEIDEADLISLAEKSYTNQLTWGVHLDSAPNRFSAKQKTEIDHSQLIWFDKGTPNAKPVLTMSPTRLVGESQCYPSWTYDNASEASYSTVTNMTYDSHSSIRRSPTNSTSPYSYGEARSASVVPHVQVAHNRATYGNPPEFSVHAEVPPQQSFYHNQFGSMNPYAVQNTSPQQPWPESSTWPNYPQPQRQLGNLNVTTAPEPWLSASNFHQHQPQNQSPQPTVIPSSGYNHPDQPVHTSQPYPRECSVYCE